MVVSSVEPKAAETARLVADSLGIPFETAAGLHEHDRSDVGFMGAAEFEAAVARFFAHPTEVVLGKETADQAHARFAAAVAAVMAQHSDETVAIVAHGTVITLLVAQAAGLEPSPSDANPGYLAPPCALRVLHSPGRTDIPPCGEILTNTTTEPTFQVHTTWEPRRTETHDEPYPE